MEGGEDSRSAQKTWVVHQHFLIGFCIVVKIARDAVYFRRRAGDYGDVVGISKRGNDRIDQAAGATSYNGLEIGHDLLRRVEVILGAAVDTDADNSFVARAVGAIIDFNHSWGPIATRK